MNRREAIAALTSLPGVARISVAKPDPDDAIVVEFDGHLTDHQVDHIKVSLERIWPGRQILVFTEGLRMKFAKR